MAEEKDINSIIDEAFDVEDPEEAELLAIKSKREALENVVKNNVWGYSSLGIEAKKIIVSL